MLALLHNDYPQPFFEVLGVENGGRTILVHPLWGNAEQRSLTYRLDKATYRAAGYYPKEIDDALKPELQT